MKIFLLFFRSDHKIIEPKGAAKTQNLEKLQTENVLQKDFLNNQYKFIKTQIRYSPYNRNHIYFQKKEEKDWDYHMEVPEFEDEFEEDLKKLNKNEPKFNFFKGFIPKLSKKSLSNPKYCKEHVYIDKKNTRFKEIIEMIMEKSKRNHLEKHEMKVFQKNLAEYNEFFDKKLEFFTKKYL